MRRLIMAFRYCSISSVIRAYYRREPEYRVIKVLYIPPASVSARKRLHLRVIFQPIFGIPSNYDVIYCLQPPGDQRMLSWPSSDGSFPSRVLSSRSARDYPLLRGISFGSRVIIHGVYVFGHSWDIFTVLVTLIYYYCYKYSFKVQILRVPKDNTKWNLH